MGLEQTLDDTLKQAIKDRDTRSADVVRMIKSRLAERRTQLAGTMSGGEQAMLSIGRGLMCAPKLLLVDEPSLGLSPLLVKENFNIIRGINERGITVLLVEQNVHDDGEQVPRQTRDAQSSATRHDRPSEHAAHDPPQSMSVSVPFLVPSLHCAP